MDLAKAIAAVSGAAGLVYGFGFIIVHMYAASLNFTGLLTVSGDLQREAGAGFLIQLLSASLANPLLFAAALALFFWLVPGKEELNEGGIRLQGGNSESKGIRLAAEALGKYKTPLKGTGLFLLLFVVSGLYFFPDVFSTQLDWLGRLSISMFQDTGDQVDNQVATASAVFPLDRKSVV